MKIYKSSQQKYTEYYITLDRYKARSKNGKREYPFALCVCEVKERKRFKVTEIFEPKGIKQIIKDGGIEGEDLVNELCLKEKFNNNVAKSMIWRLYDSMKSSETFKSPFSNMFYKFGFAFLGDLVAEEMENDERTSKIITKYEKIERKKPEYKIIYGENVDRKNNSFISLFNDFTEEEMKSGIISKRNRDVFDFCSGIFFKDDTQKVIYYEEKKPLQIGLKINPIWKFDQNKKTNPLYKIYEIVKKNSNLYVSTTTFDSISCAILLEEIEKNKEIMEIVNNCK